MSKLLPIMALAGSMILAGPGMGESRALGQRLDAPLPRPAPQPNDPPVPPAVEPLPAGQTGESLTLQGLEEMALRRHPGLARAGARIRGAQGNWVQVGLRPNPTLGIQSNEIGNEGTAGQHGFFYQQTYIRGGKLQLNRAVADREVEQAEQLYASQQLRVLTDVRVAFYEVLAAQQTRAVSQRLVEISQQLVDTTQKLLETQEVSRVELLQAQVEFQNTRMRLDLAENRYRAAWRRLAAVVGNPALPPAPLDGELEAEVPQREWEEVVDMLLAQSPQMQAARIAVERAEWALRRATVEPIPDVQVQLGVQYDDGSQDVFGGVQVGMTLPVYDRNQGAIGARQADLLQAEANVDRLKLSLQSQLAAVFERYQNAIRQSDRYRDEILPQTQETMKLVRQGYLLGELNFLTLLTAQRSYFQASLDYIEALRLLRSTSQQLDGLLLQNSLDE